MRQTIVECQWRLEAEYKAWYCRRQRLLCADLHLQIISTYDIESSLPGLTFAANEAPYAPVVLRVLPHGPPGSSAAPSAQALRAGSNRGLRLPAEGMLAAGLCDPANQHMRASPCSKSGANQKPFFRSCLSRGQYIGKELFQELKDLSRAVQMQSMPSSSSCVCVCTFLLICQPIACKYSSPPLCRWICYEHQTTKFMYHQCITACDEPNLAMQAAMLIIICHCQPCSLTSSSFL